MILYLILINLNFLLTFIKKMYIKNILYYILFYYFKVYKKFLYLLIIR